MVSVVDLWYLQFPENKFELLYSYVARFARRGLIHAQFKGILLSLFNSYIDINKPTVHVCNITKVKQSPFSHASFLNLSNAHKYLGGL